jgi:3-oxoacyl-[acyl-carrier protein] reductase
MEAVPIMGKLEGKVAIVTGAGRGIGRAIALKLAAEGAHVVVNDLDEQPAGAVTDEINSGTGPRALAFPGDVTLPEFGDDLVDAALDGFGGLDVLVNNAGYIWNSALLNHSDEQWEAMLAVHATAPFRILRAAGRHFREQAKAAQARGERPPCRKVVNVSSISGVYGAATQASYAAGKAAVIGLTKSLSKEWGPYNVTVNAVAFGYIETRLTQTIGDEVETIDVKGRQHRVGLTPEAIEAYRSTSPLRRAGAPEDAANAVALFCFPESDFVTGEVLIASGGTTG